MITGIRMQEGCVCVSLRADECVRGEQLTGVLV